MKCLSIEHNESKLAETFMVQWLFFNVCNFKCSYCNPILNNGSVQGVDLDLAISFIDKIFAAKPNKQIFIRFTGGEITFYKHFKELLGHVKAKGGFTGIISNGSRDLSWWKENYHLIDDTFLSFHAEEGRMDKWYEIAAFLHDKTTVHLNIMMMPDRFDALYEFSQKLAAEIEGVSVILQPLFETFYTREQLEILKNPNLKHGSDIQHKVRPGFERKSFQPEMKQIFSDGSEGRLDIPKTVAESGGRWKKWECYVGMENLAIDFTGKITRSACNAGGVIGRITDPHFVFPTNPILCPNLTCSCGFDIGTTKKNIFGL